MSRTPASPSSAEDSWRRYRDRLCVCPSLGLRLDTSAMAADDDALAALDAATAGALDDMEALERGAIANPDENRRVGHYWLRAPWQAPTADLTKAIERAIAQVEAFAASVHDGSLRAPSGERFTDLLVIGIGGSALGPQLVSDALGDPVIDRMTVRFFDNTDPHGMARTLAVLGDALARTLCLVISKSGGTAETRNGMLVARAAFEARGATFAGHAVAITGVGSRLDQLAEEERWLARFPMWDWVGGRTSVTSAVGLLPAALQGLDVDGLLAGAAACDEATRRREVAGNPAAVLARHWYLATDGRGARDMVVLPYKDRLLLLSRYLQQLVMESLGKDRDRDGEPVAQGIAVYGNKGSTDQHAYVQQLRDGVDNFFVTFLEVLEDGGGTAAQVEVEPGVIPGDYLRGFLFGTRHALAERGRPSMTLTVERVDAWSLGVLIALFERAVGLYASLINVNAYHQPGVEAGKKAAVAVLDLQKALVAALASASAPRGVEALAQEVGTTDVATVWQLLEAFAANERVERVGASGFDAAYRLVAQD